MTAGLLLAALLPGALCATLTAESGRWSAPGTWGGSVPAASDNVIVPDGVTVEFDAVTPRLGWIEIEAGGTIEFDDGAGEGDTEISITANTILVAGRLIMGTAAAPMARPVRVTLVNDDPPPDRLADSTGTLISGRRQKMLAVYNQGEWQAHAVGRTPTWTMLTETAQAGDSELRLVEPVDWKVGDEIIVTTTDFDAGQTEERFIVGIDATRTIIELDAPLTYMHWGELMTYGSHTVDQRAEVAVLTSNMVIDADMETSPAYSESEWENQGYELQYGGHTISLDESLTQLEGVKFTQLGQVGRIARYPVHFHYRGDTRGQGQYVRRCLLVRNFMRALTIHQTDGVEVADSVGYLTLGHMFYLEDGPERFNVFTNNLGVGALPQGDIHGFNPAPPFLFVDGGLKLQDHDNRPSIFWIENVENTFLGNVAVGSVYGIWVRVDLVFDEEDFGVVTLDTKHGHGSQFNFNKAHAMSESGIWVKENWVPCRVLPGQGCFGPDRSDNQIREVVEGFQAYKCRMGIELYGIGEVDFVGAIMADNGRAFVVDWQRLTSSRLIDSLIVGETANVGNPSDEYCNQHGWFGLCSSCSPVTPGVRRTMPENLGHNDLIGIKFPDSRLSLQNVEIMHLRSHPACAASRPGDAQFTAAAFQMNDRGLARVDRFVDGVTFVDTEWVPIPAEHAPTFQTPDDRTDNTRTYMNGWFDADGSFPCSEPGAHLMVMTDGVASRDCTLLTNYGLHYCPPGNYRYRSVDVTTYVPSGGWDTWDSSRGELYAHWECGQTLHAQRRTANPANYRLVVRTDKVYRLQFESDPQYIRLSPAVEFRKDYDDGRHLFEAEQMTFTMEVTGRVRFEAWSEPLDRNQPGNVLGLLRGEDPEQECHCGTSYVRFNLAHVLGENGGPVQINTVQDNSIECDDVCGTPFPIEDPEDCSVKVDSETTFFPEFCATVATGGGDDDDDDDDSVPAPGDDDDTSGDDDDDSVPAPGDDDDSTSGDDDDDNSAPAPDDDDDDSSSLNDDDDDTGDDDDDGGSSSGPPLGIIVGGAVGGLVVATAGAVAIRKRRQARNDNPMFELS